MQKDDDVREHLRKFFDAVDKLAEMEVEINADLLAILLLYSLPSAFDNFRCAIEPRDELPSPETLRVKIIEESDARKHDAQGDISNAMVANKHNGKPSKTYKKKEGFSIKDDSNAIKIKCYKCRKVWAQKIRVSTNLRKDKSKCTKRRASFVLRRARHANKQK